MRPNNFGKEIEDLNRADADTIHPEMTGMAGTPSTVLIYENEIPEFVPEALERIYCSIYCSTKRFELFDSLSGVSTYVSMDGPNIDTLILFRIVGRAVHVLNQQIRLHTHQMQLFSDSVFARYGYITRIEFYALDATVESTHSHFLCQVVPRLDEHVVELPDTREAYLQHSQARAIRRWLSTSRRLQREYPSYRSEVQFGKEIKMEQIQELVELTDRRMHFKHRSPYVQDSQISLFAELASTHGCMALIYIEERMCAAVLCYIAGDRCFVQLVGHDPEWNSYGLGNIVQLDIILHCIDRGIKEILMMGGGDEAKARFLAKQKILNSVTIYRTAAVPIHDWKRYVQNGTEIMMDTCKRSIKRSIAEPGFRGSSVAGLVAVTRATRKSCRRVQQATIGLLGKTQKYRRERQGAGVGN